MHHPRLECSAVGEGGRRDKSRSACLVWKLIAFCGVAGEGPLPRQGCQVGHVRNIARMVVSPFHCISKFNSNMAIFANKDTCCDYCRFGNPAKEPKNAVYTIWAHEELKRGLLGAFHDVTWLRVSQEASNSCRLHLHFL